MKVYVDELPKSCNDCKFQVFIAHHQNGWQHKERYCSIMTDNYDCKCSKENCPLQSLADHTKQVRKEVCEIFKEAINECRRKYYQEFLMHSNPIRERYYRGYDFIRARKLEEILDQIQGE